MPHYVIERTFPEGLLLPMDETGVAFCRTVVNNNAQAQVTWIHSYVSEDKRKSFCIYDRPSPEAIRQPHGGVNFRWIVSRKCAPSTHTSTRKAGLRDESRFA